MIKCNACGAELNGTEKFCRVCGTAVTQEKTEDTKVPELTLTPPDTLVQEAHPVQESEPVPTSAETVMNEEPPEAPGSTGMPEQPNPETSKTAPVVAAAPQQNEYSYRYRQPSEQQNAYRPNAPVYTADDNKRPERVIGMWGYVLSLFLMSLPIAGFVLQIIWACGGTNSLNRRNLARGALFLWVVRLALSLMIVVLCMAFFARLVPEIISQFISQFRYYF